MIFVEMSRDLAHGGKGWEFPTCVWSPTQKEKGGTWAFWEMLLRAREGDLVLHLRGVGKAAAFVGYSTVATSGYRTNRKPPQPDAWSWSGEFYRAELTNYVPFAKQILLVDLFARRRAELEAYFWSNRARSGLAKKHIFFVVQSERLQCLNGAYFSEVDAELQIALFADQMFGAGGAASQGEVTVGTQLRQVLARIGQREFSESVRDAYANRCCFPGCDVSDRRFLVASHIARWADNEALRGQIGNGLCLCLNHDKAFEAGLFYLEDDFSVSLAKQEDLPSGAFGLSLLAARGLHLTPGKAPILIDAVREHRSRTAHGR